MSPSASQRGSTLIELLISTLVAGMVLVAVAIGVMGSIQRTAQARYKDVATLLAQEAIETLLRGRAQLGWDSFIAAYPDGTNNTYCLSDEIHQLVKAPSCETIINRLNQKFVRTIQVTSDGTQVTVTVEVEWAAGKIATAPKVVMTQTFMQTY